MSPASGGRLGRTAGSGTVSWGGEAGGREEEVRGMGRNGGGTDLRREPPGNEGEEERAGEAWGGHRSAGTWPEQ